MKKLVSLFLCLCLCLGLGASALASTAPEDLFRPQAWFGDWADSYELIDWDFYDDTNAAGLIVSFTSEPVSGQQLFEAYTARLEESDLVTETSRQRFESEYGDYDQEICYTYMGAGNVGSVTSLLSRWNSFRFGWRTAVPGSCSPGATGSPWRCTRTASTPCPRAAPPRPPQRQTAPP